jgi:hypothetical protein
MVKSSRRVIFPLEIPSSTQILKSDKTTLDFKKPISYHFFRIPIMLRIYFKYNRSPTARFCKKAHLSLTMYPFLGYT